MRGGYTISHDRDAPAVQHVGRRARKRGADVHYPLPPPLAVLPAFVRISMSLKAAVTAA